MMPDLHKPTILVTNDDGIHSPGIRFLISVAASFGHVVVVAPREGMSGMSHAITMKAPLRYQALTPNGVELQYAVNGTPVDCVKLALRKILKTKPDLILSGVNHGSNASVNVIYSGTMAAALEGAMAGIPSIGFSLLDFDEQAPLEHLRPFLETIVRNTLKQGLPANVCLNVNIPSVTSADAIKGIRVCRMALGLWKEDFEERIDPHQQPYFWMRGDFIRRDHGVDTDIAALEEGWISLVPVHFDFTAFNAFTPLSSWEGVSVVPINLPDYETAKTE